MSAAGSGEGEVLELQPSSARRRTPAPQPGWDLNPSCAPPPSWNWLAHPFHRRWFAGTLPAAAICTYAGEYHHVLTTLASCARVAAELSPGPFAPALRRSAQLREHDVALWLEFAAEVGWRDCGWFYGEDPLPATAACVSSWAPAPDASGMDREDSATRLLVTLYAVESVQASVVGLQGDALVRLYGLRNPDATAYFRARTARSQHDWTLAWAALSRIARTGDPRWSKQEPATGGRSWLSDCLELRWSSYRALLDAVHELTLEASGVKS